jgi:uncharacterized membrane protein
MQAKQVIDIDAPPERVWAVLIDVERWPQWTESITSIEKLSRKAIGKGSEVRIKQPRLRPLVWQVTDFEPNKAFDWEALSPGMKAVAEHHIEPLGEGSRVTLFVEQTGVFATVFGGLVKELTARYLEMEAQGLKRRVESGQPVRAPIAAAKAPVGDEPRRRFKRRA